MREGWRDVPLGEFLTPRRVAVEPRDRVAYSQLTLSINGHGARLRRVVDGSEARASRQFRASVSDLVVSKIDARNGAAAVVPPALDGAIVTADFPTYRIETSVATVRFVDLLVRHPSFAKLADAISSGTTNRVRMDMERFPNLIVRLPPRAEQQRIVDLIDAFDVAAEASRREVHALRLTHRTVREQMLSETDATVPLGEVVAGIEAGRSPEGVDRLPEGGEASVLKVSAVRPGWFDRTQVKVVADTSVFPEHALVRDGDLLMIRANGNRDLLGVVCIVEAPLPGCYLSDKTLRIVPDATAVSPVFLMEVLMSAASRRQIALSGTGSASMKNISQSSIQSIVVPLLSKAEQTRLVSITSSLRDATLRAEWLADSLAKSRLAVLTALLTGDIAIPESYDRLLDSVA